MKCENCGESFKRSIEKEGVFCPACSSKFTPKLVVWTLICLIGVLFDCFEIILSFGIVYYSTRVIVNSISSKKISLMNLIFISIFSFVLTLVLFIFAKNGVPEVIRKIPGKDYYIGLLLYALVSGVISKIIVSIYFRYKVYTFKNIILQENFSDKDLMLLNGFSSYKILGYYLLKMKLDNIIHYRVKEAEQKAKKIAFVELNEEYGEEQLNKYCENDINIKRIIEFLKNRSLNKEELTEITIQDIVNNPELLFDNEYDSPGGIQYDSLLERIERKVKLIYMLTVSSFGYLSITKLLMGKSFGKPIENLTTLIIITMLAFGAILTYKQVRRYAMKKLLGRLILAKNTIVFDNYIEFLEKVHNNDIVVLEEDKKKILRCYATNKYEFDSNNTPLYEGAFSCALFGAVALAEMANMRHNSGSGTGGCSSCSSCGGCGGCGGCGD